jgi:hypothetical protein
MPKKIANKKRKIRRQEKEARTTQRITTTTIKNIMRIQR